MSNEVKDSFTGTIVGTVKEVRSGQRGRYLRLEFKPNPNAEWPDRATAWSIPDEVQVSDGDRVMVSGRISVRKSERDGKTYVDISVNAPEVVVLSSAAAPVEPWDHVVDGYDDTETPF